MTVSEIQRQIDTGGAIALSGMSGVDAEGDDAERLQACIMQGLKIESDRCVDDDKPWNMFSLLTLDSLLRAHAKAGTLNADVDESYPSAGSRIAQTVIAFREM